MKNKLYTINEVTEFINAGKLLSLAGDERVLSKLPKGNWIGGTTPYFMDAKKGQFNQELIFVNNLLEEHQSYKIESYTSNKVNNIVSDTFSNGYSLVIIPPFTDIHQEYAIKIPNNENLFNNPIIGWIAGIDLNSTDICKTFNGQTGEVFTDRAVTIHIELSDDKIARLEIINIFDQSTEDVELEFSEDGFSCKTCFINGKETNFAEYIEANNIDIKLPLISDYSGALINVSFQSIEDGTVNFYAPVFKGTKYKFAQSMPNYVSSFDTRTQDVNDDLEFSSNCILNYLYGELEGKKIKNVTGPITFGEIGYMLLNQTLTFLYIENK